MYFKIILLILTISLTTLPNVSHASDCTQAMQTLQIALDNLNDAQASGNKKWIFMAQRDYFNALGEVAVCTDDWIGDV